MRNSKIVALVATAALLVLGAAFTAFAATGWVQENGVWKYYDKYGVAVSQEWEKSGSDYYYLDENGEMTVSQIVDDGTNLYYVDESGKMVKNAWEKIDNTDDDDGDEYYWYYFQANGKAVKYDTLKLKTVNGKKYIFDENGHMQYGWIVDGTTSKDDEDVWQEAQYYAGGQDDGAVRVSVWKQIEVIDNRDDSGVIDQNYWFYFGSNGKKIAATTDNNLYQKTINGKTYVFDECGVMLSSWEAAATTATTAGASISSYYYFKSSDDGAKLKKSWFRVAPTSGVNYDDYESDTPHWYYANGDGTIAKDQIKTIKGKKYLFDANGEMQSGLVVLTTDGTLDYVVDESAEISALTAAGAGEKLVAYFGDEETDGSMKTGTVTVSIDGDDYSVLINTTGASKGLAYNGLKNKTAWYENGVKLCADSDIKLQAFPCDIDSGLIVDITGEALSQTEALHTDFESSTQKYCLITSSGSIIKNATTKKDADGIKYTVSNYQVTKCVSE